MTAIELIKKFNSEPDFYKNNSIYPVDAETYGYCFQYVIDQLFRKKENYRLGSKELGQYNEYHIICGVKYQGLMFKNVELVLERR